MANRFIRRKKAKIKLKNLFPGKKLPDGMLPHMGISEEARDRLNKRDWTKPLERKLHERDPSTMTTKELIEIRFSGIRIDEHRMMAQIWVDGQVRVEADARAVAKDPTILAEMHERAFQTSGSMVDIDPTKTTDAGIIH